MRRVLASMALCASIGIVPTGAQAAFPGANGDIVFGRFVGEGGGRIFTLTPSSSAQTELTPGGRVCRHPTYSGDGERIAFSCITGPMIASSEIFTMAANGQDEVQVTTNGFQDLEPSFSPDGRTIAFGRFEASDGAVVAIGADGQNEITLTDTATSEFAPSYSPDGTKIVFVRDDGADNEIWAMNADGSNQVQLTDNTVFDGAPSYSPDGTKIVFARRDGSDNDLFVMDADGANQTPLTDTPGSEATPAYSPDGRKLVYSLFDSGTMTTRLWLADADGRNAAELTSVVPPEADFQPNWQPLNPPDCALEGQPKQEHFTALIRIRCSENASVSAAAAFNVRKPKRAAASKLKSVAYAPVTLQVEANTFGEIVLEPATRKGRKLIKGTLRAGKKAKGSIEVTATDDLGASAGYTFAIKLKRGKKTK